MIIIRLICLAAYYGFARFLPASTSPRTKWARSIRRFICRPLFDACGDNVNVEKGAVFSTGGESLLEMAVAWGSIVWYTALWRLEIR